MGLLDAWRRRRERRAVAREEKRARKRALRGESAAARVGRPLGAGSVREVARPTATGRPSTEGPSGLPDGAETGLAEAAPTSASPADEPDLAEPTPAPPTDASQAAQPHGVVPVPEQGGPLVPPAPDLPSLDPAVKAERRRRVQGSRPRRAAEPAPLPPDEARGLLQALAGEHLPPDASAALLELARPALRLHAHASDDPGGGSSRLGGLPVLPPQVDWPTYAQEPLHFVAQVRLEEAASQDVELALPRFGFLSFFYLPGEDVWGYDPRDRGAWKVLRFDASAATPRQPPEGLEVYEPRHLATHGTWSLPDRFAEALAPVRELAGDEAALDGVLGAYAERTGRVRHQLLGWPAEGQDPMARAAAAASAGLYAGTGRLDDATLTGIGALPGRWRMLLQLDSDDDAGMVWGDDCRLCFWLPDDALRAGRFADTWMLVRCG